jgi:hypothetical protein
MKQEKHTIPYQMERISSVRKFLASRERINSRQRTPEQIQAKGAHSSVAGAIEP